jgi:membrane associated rhomboid family serine protease
VIPLRDVIPSRRLPVFTVGIIVLNTLAFLYELSVPEEYREMFFRMYAVVPALFNWPSVFTSMFLHAGWLHFLGNMLYLWIFGDNVEDRLGHVRFVIFYLFCGAVAAVAHAAINPSSTVPTIGASGAIAGVMGAYFVLFPRSRILAVVPLFFYMEIIEVPALLFLGFWFIMQFFSGIGSLAVSGDVQSGGVAFWAHVAGFIAGIVGVAVFRIRKSRAEWS